MLDDTATSSAVTSSLDACDCDAVQTNDVVDDVVAPAVRQVNDVSGMIVGEYDVDTTAEYVDVSSTSPVRSRAEPVDQSSSSGDAVEKPVTGRRSECLVCGDDAAGMYFGALVCVPCKTFFLRYAGDGYKFKCKYSGRCEVTLATRTHCKSCRYEKCLRVGMRRRVRPAQVEITEGQQMCAICSDVGNGIHFGVITCEGCKKFFRRGLVEYMSYRCKNKGCCLINPQTRNLCRFCRYQKCIAAGMSRNAIQMGRPTKYTASAAGCGLTSGMSHEINVANSNSSTSSTSHLGRVITPWYQTPSWKSLLQQHLLVHRPSAHAADAVNPWLATSPDVSLSPDSTVKEMEQTSNESEDVTKHQVDALDLCQKSVVSIRSSLMSQLSANISTSIITASGSLTENCAQSLRTEPARRWSHCSGTPSIVAHADHSMRHTSNPVLNLSVKSLELRHKKSSSPRIATTFSHTDSDSDCSGLSTLSVCSSDFVCQLCQLICQ